MALRPRRWDAYDSYGEALLQAGRKAEAAAMERKSGAPSPGSARPGGPGEAWRQRMRDGPPETEKGR